MRKLLLLTLLIIHLQIPAYSDENVNSDTIVSINLNTKNESPLILDNKNLTYKEVINKIGMSNKFILTVDSKTNENITYINIIKATEEELQEEW